MMPVFAAEDAVTNSVRSSVTSKRVFITADYECMRSSIRSRGYVCGCKRNAAATNVITDVFTAIL